MMDVETNLTSLYAKEISASLEWKNRRGFDTEAILDGLYASQIDGSIEWIWDGGFVASLGGPNKAEAWSLETVADAVEWLRQEACRRYPDTEFARKYGSTPDRPISRMADN